MTPTLVIERSQLGLQRSNKTRIGNLGTDRLRCEAWAMVGPEGAPGIPMVPLSIHKPKKLSLGMQATRVGQTTSRKQSVDRWVVAGAQPLSLER